MPSGNKEYKKELDRLKEENKNLLKDLKESNTIIEMYERVSLLTKQELIDRDRLLDAHENHGRDGKKGADRKRKAA